jgi:hypothetical protein
MRTRGGLELWVEFFAEHGERTFSALGISGGAAVTTEEDNAVAEITAFFRRQDLPKLLFHLFGFFSG